MILKSLPQFYTIYSNVGKLIKPEIYLWTCLVRERGGPEEV